MFFKKKPLLREIIPHDYVDIHSHILPGIDDGSKNVESSIKLLRALKNLGFTKMIPTPHTMHGVWDNNPETIFEAFMKLKENLPKDLEGMIPHFATEYMVNFDFNKMITSEELLTYNDRYILMEFSFMESPKIIFDVISGLQSEDYKIILAHPERYNYYHDKYYLYEELKSYDIKFQVNLLSTVGHYGKKIAEVADRLLKDGFIDFAGSDVHHSGHIDAFDKRLKIKSKHELVQAMQSNSKLVKNKEAVRKSLAK